MRCLQNDKADERTNSTIFAVPAFAGWIIPYFLYRKVARKPFDTI